MYFHDSFIAFGNTIIFLKGQLCKVGRTSVRKKACVAQGLNSHMSS